jgi:8-oxo-dGTP pyrophosphatase MutT (NUDIX family)
MLRSSGNLVWQSQTSSQLHAALRELYEETGIPPEAVRVVHVTSGWLHYEWPERTKQKKLQAGSANWKGQRQVCFYVPNENLSTLLCTSATTNVKLPRVSLIGNIF